MRCLHQWLTLESLDVVEEFVGGRPLGILSVDVDGNDYWFLRKLIGMRPAVIVCEFNRAFAGRPITVPYDASFDRFAKHPSGLYFGASLSALDHLCGGHGYVLRAISSNGVNAFYVRTDLLPAADMSAESRIELTSAGGGDPFDVIAALPFVDVTQFDSAQQAAGNCS